MIAGYVTYDELKLITGFDDKLLNKLILLGMNYHELDLDHTNFTSKYKEQLFNLEEVEEWIRMHIF